MFIEDFMGLHPLKMSILTANVSCSRPSGIYYSTSGSWMHFIMGSWFGVLMALYGGYIRVFFLIQPITQRSSLFDSHI